MSIKPGFRLAAFSCVAALAVLASAADAQTEALLAQMRNAYRSAKTARFNVNSSFKSLKGFNKYVNSFSYKAPNRIRLAITSPTVKGTLVKVTDGKKISLSGQGFKAPVQAYSIDQFEASLPVNLESLCFWDWDRQLSTAKGHNMAASKLAIKTESWNGKTWTVLEETATAQQIFVRYYVDPQSHLIWRTHVFTTAKKEISDAVVTSMSINVPISDSVFNVGPSGISV